MTGATENLLMCQMFILCAFSGPLKTWTCDPDLGYQRLDGEQSRFGTLDRICNPNGQCQQACIGHRHLNGPF